MKLKVLFLLSAILLSISLSAFSAGETNPSEIEEKLQKEKKRLDLITRELSKRKENIKKTQKKEKSILTQLNEIEMELSKKRSELKQLHAAIDKLEKKIRENLVKINDLKHLLEKRKEHLLQRMVALYKYAKVGGGLPLLATSSHYDILKASYLLKIILESDSRAITTYYQNLHELNNYQESLKEGNLELKNKLAEVELKEKEIKEKQKEKIALLNSLRTQKSLQLAAVKELETSSKNLQDLIRQLEMKAAKKDKISPTTTKGFALMKGKLPFPVEGKVISRFGKFKNEELHTIIFQKGIEIAAPIGTEIKAVYPGKVLYADWLKGYGKIIIIDHGEGYYTLSAFTSELLKKVGDEVKAGETIALVGDTNSLKGSCLYFEIRYHGNPQDPLEWLSETRHAD